MTTENRSQQRRRVLKAGKILFAHGACMLDCTIKNISEHGAMLQIESSVSVPDQFQLYEPSRLLLHEVRVVRRASRLLGIAITSTRDIAESVDPRLRRLRLMQ
jgi:hypothetical protein